METQLQHSINLIHQAISTTLGLQKGRKSDLSPIATAILYNSHIKKLQITDISDMFDIKKSTASGYIDNLEKKGYVTRVKDEANLKNTYVIPTEKGEKWLQTKEKTLADFVTRHMANLTVEEQTVFLGLLEKFMKPNIAS